jgi:hypothetical protein
MSTMTAMKTPKTCTAGIAEARFAANAAPDVIDVTSIALPAWSKA